ncbi:MAG: cadmium-translocating P-type ATPase [Firmicutes bacterium]|nr:cadmium-translocating P-type ATPase [Bacillota bacterium]
MCEKSNCANFGAGTCLTDRPKIEIKGKPGLWDVADKETIARVIISILLFVTALIIDKYDKYQWLKLALFFASYIIVGVEVLINAFKNIVRGNFFDENFLMGIATIGAFIIKEYPEGVAVMLFYQVGEILQNIAVDRSRKSIENLIKIKPDFANLKLGENIVKVMPEKVKTGELIIVKPGEKVPLDGIVVEGVSTVDTSTLTGESIPITVEAGSEVLSGSINKNNLLTVKVTKEYSDSTISKILDMVQNAASKKAPTEKFITRFAKYYTPAVVLIAVIIAVIPPIITKSPASPWIYRSLLFLVISCPCALVISIPLSYLGGIGGASGKGILIKGSNYLEALNNVEIAVFDKTGTLTKGVFKVSGITPQEGFTEEELLEYAAYAEYFSNHPIALSIINAYGKKIEQSIIDNFQEIPGYGVKVNVKGKKIAAGNFKFMLEENITINGSNASNSVIYVAIDGKYAGFITISDEIKEDSVKSIKALKDMGIDNIVMLTGDNKNIALQIGNQLDIDQVYAELLPHEKVEKLEMLDKQKSPRGKLLFAGDGINDAPVLAQADIGVAMGGLGSDAAMEAADIVLMTDEPSKLVSAINIAKKTKAIVIQNIALALGIKGLVLILGSTGIATMWGAVFADVGVALLAVLNAMRVLTGSQKYKKSKYKKYKKTKTKNQTYP